MRLNDMGATLVAKNGKIVVGPSKSDWEAFKDFIRKTGQKRKWGWWTIL